MEMLQQHGHHRVAKDDQLKDEGGVGAGGHRGHEREAPVQVVGQGEHVTRTEGGNRRIGIGSEKKGGAIRLWNTTFCCQKKPVYKLTRPK
jgi:hypothetical protein